MSEDWERQVAENARRYQELQRQVAAMAVTETSGDGNVVVTVSASGQLTSLVLREPWEPRPMAEVADEIMKTMRRAQSRIPDLLERAVQETVGRQDPSAHLILADTRARFPNAVPPARTPEEPARKPARKAPPQWSDDEWERKPILEDI